eukprot:7889118-Pyramimonas_sp.AAC.1
MNHMILAARRISAAIAVAYRTTACPQAGIGARIPFDAETESNHLRPPCTGGRPRRGMQGGGDE